MGYVSPIMFVKWLIPVASYGWALDLASLFIRSILYTTFRNKKGVCGTLQEPHFHSGLVVISAALIQWIPWNPRCKSKQVVNP